MPPPIVVLNGVERIAADGTDVDVDPGAFQALHGAAIISARVLEHVEAQTEAALEDAHERRYAES